MGHAAHGPRTPWFPQALAVAIPDNLYNAAIERTDRDGVDTDELLLSVQEKGDKVLAIRLTKEFMEDLGRVLGTTHTSACNPLSALADESDLVNRDAVDRRLLRG